MLVRLQLLPIPTPEKASNLGIGIVRMNPSAPGELPKEWVTNLSALRKKIIWLFGDAACRMYRINPKTVFEV